MPRPASPFHRTGDTAAPVASHSLAPRPCSRTLARAALAAAIVAAAWHAPSVRAQAEPRQAISVPASSLEKALNTFALQAGITLSFDPALTATRNAPALQGRFTPAEGLARLLESHNLQAVRMPDGSYTLRVLPKTNPQDAGILQAVTVTADAESSAPYTAPASVHRLNAEQLERVPVTSPSDVFRGIPGLTVANSRNGPSIDVNIRGMQGQGRVKVLVDGTQSSSSSHRGYAGGQDQTYIDPDLLSSITVEKGPSSGPYGAGVVGGIVSLQTLQASDLIRDDRAYGLRLRGSLGSNGDAVTRQDAAGASLPGNNRSGSIAAAWRPNEYLELLAAHAQRANGNYSAGKRGDATYVREVDGKEYPLSPNLRPGDEIHNTSQDSRSTLLKAKLRLPHDQTLAFDISDYRNRYGEFRGTLFDYQLSQQRLSEVSKRTYTARYNWNPDSPWIDLKANLWKADLHEERWISMPTIADTDTHGFEVWNTSRATLGPADFKLTAGASFMKEITRVVDSTENTTYREVPDGKRDMSSVFGQVEAWFSDWLAVEAGLRYDRYSLQGQGWYDSPILGQNDVAFALDRSKGRASPSFALTASPVKWLQGFVRYSEGWRPPSTKESLLAYSRSQRPLDPETAKSLEIGANLLTENLLAHNDRLRAKLAWFNNRHDDYIVGATGAFRNIDGARFRGTELALEYDTGWLFAELALTRYDRIAYCGVSFGEPCLDTLPSNIAIGGQDSMGIYSPPRWTRQATIGVRLLERRLVLGARINAAGDRGLNTSYPPGERLSRSNWAPYETYNLFGSYAVSKALNVAFSIENLRDRYYLDTSTNSRIAIPSPGRTARVTLTYLF